MMGRSPGGIIGALVVLALIIASFIVISKLKQRFLEDNPNPTGAMVLMSVCYILAAIFAVFSIIVIAWWVQIAKAMEDLGGTGSLGFYYFLIVAVIGTPGIVYLCQAISITRRYSESKKVQPQMQCPNCGQLINEGAPYCPYCFENITPESVTTSIGSRKLICTNCGLIRLMPSNVTECPHCGSKMVSQSEIELKAKQNEDKQPVYAANTKPGESKPKSIPAAANLKEPTNECGTALKQQTPSEAEYKFCENCGQKMYADSKFCTKCGAAVRAKL